MYHPLIYNLDEEAGVAVTEVSDISSFYIPALQRVPTERMGESRPTTRSTIDSTGIINSDGDQSNDDTGND